MSYLVLARKWRPQTFEEVTGQEHVVSTLANAIAQGRVAHALLLCGPRGVGKTTTARLLARALNCEKGPTKDPCGQCLPCREIAAGTSVDVVEIDGASNNSVDNVREIRDTVRYLPQRDRFKVYIIDEVHMLSVAAFNALLKTLEEPPPHVKFIFATTDPQKLPETILSRCQRHNFRRVSAADMVKRLRTICDAEGITISDRTLGLLARQADGGMRDALSLLDQLVSSLGLSIDDRAAEEVLGLVDSTLVLSLADALLDRDGKRVIEVVEEVYERGVDAKKLCEELAQHLRDLLYVKTVGAPPPDASSERGEEMRAQAAKADAAQLARLFDLVHGAIRDLSLAARPRLALEVALLTAVHMAPGQSVSELAARLEKVARAVMGQGALPESRPGQGAMPEARPAPRTAAAPREMAAPARSSTPAPAASARLASERPASMPLSVDELVRQVEARAQAREVRSQPATRRAAPSQDEEEDPRARAAPRMHPAPRSPLAPPPLEEPPPFDEPPPPGFSEPPARVFPPEPSPGGCATGECAADEPSLPPFERWKRFLASIRERHAVLYAILAEGRLARLGEGEVALAFGSEHGFHRAQLESGEMRALAESLLAAWFGRPTRLRLDAAVADASISVAEEERRRRAGRAEELRRRAREHPAVRAVQAVLGADLTDVEVPEDR